MKILLDMNLSPSWIGYLSSNRIEAAHWSSLGAVDATDREIMAFADQNEYIVLTQDLDFSAILAATQNSRPSVVQIRADNLALDQIGPSLVAALRQLQAELEKGAILSIDQWNRVRMRLLPLSREH
jgi:predicted nuclease of predicted toxin-antitoxin system